MGRARYLLTKIRKKVASLTHSRVEGGGISYKKITTSGLSKLSDAQKMISKCENLYKKRKYGELIALTDTILKNTPDLNKKDIENLFLYKIRSMYSLRRYREVIDLIDYKDTSIKKSARKIKLKSLEKLGLWDEIEEDIQENGIVNGFLIKALMEKREYTRALSHLESSSETDLIADQEYLYNVSQCYKGIGCTEQEDKLLKKALSDRFQKPKPKVLIAYITSKANKRLSDEDIGVFYWCFFNAPFEHRYSDLILKLSDQLVLNCDVGTITNILNKTELEYDDVEIHLVACVVKLLLDATALGTINPIDQNASVKAILSGLNSRKDDQFVNIYLNAFTILVYLGASGVKGSTEVNYEVSAKILEEIKGRNLSGHLVERARELCKSVMISQEKPFRYISNRPIENDRPKVAICFFGQVRAFERASRVISINNNSVDFDIFCSVWKERGFRFPNTKHAGHLNRVMPSKLVDVISEFGMEKNFLYKYPSIKNLLETSSKMKIDEEILRSYFGENLVSFEIEEEEDVIEGSNWRFYEENLCQDLKNQIKKLYKIYRAYNLMCSSMEEKCEYYDLVVMVRPDASINIELSDNDLLSISSGRLLCSRSTILPGSNVFHMDDKCVLGNVHSIGRYSGFFDDYDEFLTSKPTQPKAAKFAHNSSFEYCVQHGVQFHSNDTVGCSIEDLKSEQLEAKDIYRHFMEDINSGLMTDFEKSFSKVCMEIIDSKY